MQPVVTEENSPTNLSQENEKVKFRSRYLLILLLVIAFFLVGIICYLIGAKRSIDTKPSIVPTITNEPTKDAQPTSQITNPTAIPTKTVPVSWKKEVITVTSQSEMNGNKSYNFEFSYPDNWTIQKNNANHQQDNLIKNCTNFVISNESGNVNISLVLTCVSWSSESDNLPSDYKVISKMENFGNGGFTNYLIRYFSPERNTYSYSDVSVQPGKEISGSDKMDGVILVTYKPDDFFFIPVYAFLSAPSGTKMTQDEIDISDKVILSLKLLPK